LGSTVLAVMAWYLGILLLAINRELIRLLEGYGRYNPLNVLKGLETRRFEAVLSSLAVPEGDFLVHALNSAGAMRCPEYARSAVRPGIFLYGGSVGDDLAAPEAVASVHACVVHVRPAETGATVGYGSTYRAEGRERWATLAIGYGDGWPRALGNRGHALVRGHRVPIVGRISMDVTVVDISGLSAPVRVGDVATLLGADGDERITVDEIATEAGTISYEILTGLTARLPRVWTDGGE